MPGMRARERRSASTISMGARTGPSNDTSVAAIASQGMPPARPVRIASSAVACSSVAVSSRNQTARPFPSWIASGYRKATAKRVPVRSTSPYRPSETWQARMNSQNPSFGKPPNWQLQPCLQLQAANSTARMR